MLPVILQEPGVRIVDPLIGQSLSSDNQDENVATIKVRTRGRDATSAKTMLVLVDAEQGRRSGTAGMRWARRADSQVVHRPGTASVASRDGAVEGGSSEG